MSAEILPSVIVLIVWFDTAVTGQMCPNSVFRFRWISPCDVFAICTTRSCGLWLVDDNVKRAPYSRAVQGSSEGTEQLGRPRKRALLAFFAYKGSTITQSA